MRDAGGGPSACMTLRVRLVLMRCWQWGQHPGNTEAGLVPARCWGWAQRPCKAGGSTSIHPMLGVGLAPCNARGGPMPVQCSVLDCPPRDTQVMASIRSTLRAALAQVGDSGPQFGDPCIKEYTNMEYVRFFYFY